HLILGDSNILEFAMYLKLGTVSLVLSLIENEKVPHIPCMDPVTALQKITLHGDPFDPCIGETDISRKSPFDIQTIYLQAAQKELAQGSFASEKTEAELKHIGLCWEQALNAIYNRDIPWMIGRFDHVTKKYLCKQAMRYRRQENPRDIYSTLKDIDIFYHEIIVRKFQDRMNAAWPNRRLLNDKEIREAMSNPPANTRAMCRGAYIDFLHDHPHHNTMATIEWASLKQTIGTAEYVFNCPDPLEWNKEEFNLFMQTIKK
ncbi:MAG: proteasome accessory factor PafA2 family protein, partial [Patescibacteria group bacterium]